MGWLMSAVVVETDCPDCDLIERHPLDAVRRAKVLTCHGCGHRYVAEARGQLASIGRAKAADLRSWASETAYMRAPRQPLVLHVCARSVGLSAARARPRAEVFGRLLAGVARQLLGFVGSPLSGWRGEWRLRAGIPEGLGGGG